MKRFTMFLSAVIFFTCTALVIEAKKKKSSEVNSSAQNFRVNYRFWDRQVKCLRSMKGYPENTYEGIQEYDDIYDETFEDNFYINNVA